MGDQLLALRTAKSTKHYNNSIKPFAEHHIKVTVLKQILFEKKTQTRHEVIYTINETNVKVDIKIVSNHSVILLNATWVI